MNPFINDKSAIVDKDYQPAMAINIDKDKSPVFNLEISYKFHGITIFHGEITIPRRPGTRGPSSVRSARC